MTTAAKAISWSRLKRRALSLGAVKAFDHALQFLLPVVLVRCLDAATFGEYRLLWLVVGTVMTVATLNMCGTLYFFVPRSDARRKRLYVHQTLLFLAAAGLVCAALVGPWNPLLPAAMAPLARYGALVPAFVALWVVAIAARLPADDRRAHRLAGLRHRHAALLRWRWSPSPPGRRRAARRPVAAARAGAGQARPAARLRSAPPRPRRAVVRARRLRRAGRATPRRSALSNALYALRAQADQWVAASLFALSSFAAFSIAAVVGHVVHIFRHSVIEAFLPTMSRLQAAGDVRGMMKMNSRANVMVGTLLYPLLAFAFVFAEEIVTLVYTAAYVEAAPVMRVYIVGMVADGGRGRQHRAAAAPGRRSRCASRALAWWSRSR